MYAAFLLGAVGGGAELSSLTLVQLTLVLPGLYWGLAFLATALVAVPEMVDRGPLPAAGRADVVVFRLADGVDHGAVRERGRAVACCAGSRERRCSRRCCDCSAPAWAGVFTWTRHISPSSIWCTWRRDAMVGSGTSLQTHLFEDRVMKMSHVRIGSGCAVGRARWCFTMRSLRLGLFWSRFRWR